MSLLFKRAAALFIISASLLRAPPAGARAAASAPELSAKSAILVEAESGRALYEKNASEPMKIASTTKILTALVALERCGLDEIVTVKREWTGIEGSSMYLKPDEKLTVRDLLYGLMLVSGNDAAVALACHAAGGTREFAELMNERAAGLGCVSSSFANPSGLDEEGHFSTARDLAAIAAEAMKNGAFAEIVSAKYADAAGRELKNHNKLLWDYPGALGVKTGYTISAGRSLVSCAERGGMRLICVTLDDRDDWADHAALYDWAFDAYVRFTIKRGEQIGALLPVVSGVKAAVRLAAGADASFIIGRGEKYAATVKAPKFVRAAVARGGLAGEMLIELGGEVVARIPLLYDETVRLLETEKPGFWETLKRAWLVANRHGFFRPPVYC
jgi:D-alanyl-D-alanine carboxypeptidase (penicillin-binding protein 5/6)